MDQLPQNTTELLQQIDQDWTQLMNAVAALTVEQVITPNADGWTVKDHLAHLAYWEQWLLRYHLNGEPAHSILEVDAEEITEFQVDQINELVRQRSRSRPLDEVLHDLHEIHAQVVTTLTALPFDKLLQPRYADEPDKGPTLQWVIGNTYEHYQEHLALLPA